MATIPFDDYSTDLASAAWCARELDAHEAVSEDMLAARYDGIAPAPARSQRVAVPVTADDFLLGGHGRAAL